MAHTYAYEGAAFIANSDLSGDVTVVTEDGRFRVSGEAIRALVADYIVRERIAKLEQMSPQQVLLNLP